MIRCVVPALVFVLAYSLQSWVVSDPVLHVLVQFPLLIVVGYLMPIHLRLPDAAVGPLLILAIVTIAVWMLPRNVDAALQSTPWHVAKFVTLPLALGLPLRLTWHRVGPVLRGFLKAQAVSMLLFLSFLYTHAPIRLCNSYLVSDQIRLGVGFAIVAVGLAALWVIPAFIGRPTSRAKGKTHELSFLSH